MGETGLGCAEVAFRCEMVPGDPVQQQPLPLPAGARQRQRVRGFVVAPDPIFGVTERAILSLAAYDPIDAPLGRRETSLNVDSPTVCPQG